MISLIIANVINYCLKRLFSTKNKQGQSVKYSLFNIYTNKLFKIKKFSVKS